MTTADRDELSVSAVLVQPMGQIGRYQVTAVVTITCESLSQAVSAVAEALADFS